MDESIYKWLADYFSDVETQISKAYIIEMLKTERATAFLLVWPIFEQKIANGFFTKDSIEPIAQGHKNFYSQFNIEEMAYYFYHRYQDKTAYKHLRHQENKKSIGNILNTPYQCLDNEQKLTLMLYVVYRYRNNIFHGNKSIHSWSQYEKQIDYCI